MLWAAPALGQQVVASPTVDSVAQQAALERLVARVADANRLPGRLVAFRARVESEVSIVLRREDGREFGTSIEQMVSRVSWQRGIGLRQEVIGYRAQANAFALPTINYLPSGWLISFLYDYPFRSFLRVEGDSGTARRDTPADPSVATTVTARDLFADYTFTGGDTVAHLDVGSRRIAIVRLLMTPRPSRARPGMFRGEIDIDAERGAIVRVRGAYEAATSGLSRALGGFAQRAAFVDVESAEHRGTFWLPFRQRVELQAAAPSLSDGRAVIRIVSRFTDVEPIEAEASDSVTAGLGASPSDRRRTLVVAPSSELSAYHDWRAPLGEPSAGMHADDFLDVAPDQWRSSGPPRVSLAPARMADLLHVNRVEGVYTGLGLRLSLRDRRPGGVLQLHGGWAWSERTMRGGVSYLRTVGGNQLQLSAARWLDNTNDFRSLWEAGNSLRVLLASRDPYDYVDRRGVDASLDRVLHRRNRSLTMSVGVREDRAAYTWLWHGLDRDQTLPLNRPVAAGRYGRVALAAEWNRQVSSEFFAPGVGGRFSVEAAHGELSWQRAELRVFARQSVGRITWISRGDAGIVLGADVPPQQIFELGGDLSLPGYDDKVFAGTHASLVRNAVLLTLPLLEQPLRIGGRLFPAVAPTVEVSASNAWTGAPSARARAAVARLRPFVKEGVQPDVPRLTDGVRSAAAIGIRAFAGAAFLGVARAVDGGAPWRGVFTFGRAW